ncbi:hypothetical protein LJR030_000513 [Rhizobium sp. LjRoot30]|uniref:hypothetical protein n=1 Tax=Rhizobium sp. LjRoot30 TaxID=3342320 RepID=UPI003ECE6EF4
MRITWVALLGAMVGLAGCETAGNNTSTAQASCTQLEQDYASAQKRLNTAVRADPKLRNADLIVLAVEYEKNPKLKPLFDETRITARRLQENGCSVERAMAL